MGKSLSIVIGGIVLIIGIILLVALWTDFVTVILGILPAVLIFGGLIALVAGISELKDTVKSKKQEGK